MQPLSCETFDEAVNVDGAVLVDFWADWCGPCRTFTPIVESFETPDLEVAKVDADNQMGVLRRFDVLSLPTLLLFIGGNLALRLTGARSREQLAGELREALA